MDTFPIDFTPYNVLNEKRLRRERELREKIEGEKEELRTRIVQKVTKGNEERWWWGVSTESKAGWENVSFEELAVSLKQKGWHIGHFYDYETLIICTRQPTEEEIEGFFRD